VPVATPAACARRCISGQRTQRAGHLAGESFDIRLNGFPVKLDVVSAIAALAMNCRYPKWLWRGRSQIAKLAALYASQNGMDAENRCWIGTRQTFGKCAKLRRDVVLRGLPHGNHQMSVIRRTNSRSPC
jgi:hypothetical protein